MRNTLLGAAAVVALAAAGALAQQTGADPAAPPASHQGDAGPAGETNGGIQPQGGSAANTPPQVQSSDLDPGPASETNGGIQPEGGSAANPPGVTQQIAPQPQGEPNTIPGQGDTDLTREPGAIRTDSAAAEQGAGAAAAGFYSSYEQMDRFEGEVAGGHAAEDLIGAAVVGPQGETIGEIEDLAVDENSVIRHALVDVGGFFAVQDRVVMIDIADLRPGEGDAAEGEFVLDRSEAELDAMPRYERREGLWVERPTDM